MARKGIVCTTAVSALVGLLTVSCGLQLGPGQEAAGGGTVVGDPSGPPASDIPGALAAADASTQEALAAIAGIHESVAEAAAGDRPTPAAPTPATRPAPSAPLLPAGGSAPSPPASTDDAGPITIAPEPAPTTTTTVAAEPPPQEPPPQSVSEGPQGSPEEGLPGEPYEWGPDSGVSLAVVGVDHDDVLNVRDVPFGEIIATLGLANPIAFLLEVREMPADEAVAHHDTWEGAVVATGRTRRLPTTVWHEVQVSGMTGWASGAYLAPIGLTENITEQFLKRLDGVLVAPTLIDLATAVGNEFASVEPPSRVVVTVAPSTFENLGEVTVDVLNLGDDSLRGYRLYITADPAGNWMSDDPGPFTLRTVTRSVLCHSHRGVTPGGLCA